MASPEESSGKSFVPMMIVAVAVVIVGVVLFRSSGEDEPKDRSTGSTTEASSSTGVNPSRAEPLEPASGEDANRDSDDPASAASPFVDPESEVAREVPEEIRRAFEEAGYAEIPQEILDDIDSVMDPPSEHVRQQYEMIGRREIPPELREDFEHPYPPLPEEVRRQLTVDTTERGAGSAESAEQ